MKINLKTINLKKLLPPIIVILICIGIIIIGGPKKKEVAPTPMTPLVFQNKESGLYGAVDGNRKVIVQPKYKTLFSNTLDGQYYFIGTTEDGATDILTSEGIILDHVPNNYQQVSVLSLKDKLLEVSDKNNDLVGVINFKNETIVPVKYSSLSFKNDFLILNPYSNESIANSTGKILVSSKDYSSVSIQGNGIIISNKNGLYGLLNFNGDVVLQNQYTNIYGVNKNIFAIANSDGLYALFNISTQNLVTGYDYTSIQKDTSSIPFLACKLKNGVSTYGYIDSRGSTIVPFQFQSAYSFKGNTAIVQQNGLFGLIDKSGNFLLKPKYTIIPGNAFAIQSFQDGNYYVGYLDNHSEIFNSQGSPLASIPGIVQAISNHTVFYENSENKDFLYNLDTKKTIDVKDYLQPLSKGTITPAGYFGAYKDVATSKYVDSLYLYEEGKGIISLNGYTSIKFENGLFLCQSNLRYDVVQPDGKVLLSFNPTQILNISITPDKMIYVEKINPDVNRMKATGNQQKASRLISAYNFEGKEINLSQIHKA